MALESKSGTYVLVVKLTRPSDVIVASGKVFALEPGYYGYIGSALSGLKKRIERHLRQTKKLHWHIDFLLQNAVVVSAVCAESSQRIECRIARELTTKYRYIRDFGCSDCRCQSHLIYSDNVEQIIKGAMVAFSSNDLNPTVIHYM
jgi:Uri superfamily endonuclease